MKRSVQLAIAAEAARLMVAREETEYLHAKERAVQLLGLPAGSPLPTNRQIRDLIGKLAGEGGDAYADQLARMRATAEEIMSAMADFDPHLVGSTLTGHVRPGSDIDLHVFADDPDAVRLRLEGFGYGPVEREDVVNVKGRFTHLRWSEAGDPIEITVYPWRQRRQIPISSITGEPMERGDLDEVRRLSGGAS